MLTKIIFRTYILVVLTTLFACVPDESAMPKVEPDALLMTNEAANDQLFGNVYTQVISDEFSPGCTYENCSSLLPRLSEIYRALANETCQGQWYCVTCCLEGKKTDISAFVEPDNEKCSTATGQDEVYGLPIPNIPVAVLPNFCLTEGATLWAVNPKKPGNPAYSQPYFTVKWYKDGQYMANGVHLSDCICGETISVTVKNTMTGLQGGATFVAPKCANED